VILADLGAAVRAALIDAVAAGELPDSATRARPSGTWRPVPAADGGGPGTYATSLPFTIASAALRPDPGRAPDPARVANILAPRLSTAPWIEATRVTGPGYLTISVTMAHLTGLARRIAAAGPRCATSAALAGRRVSTGAACPAPAPDWPRAWRSRQEELVGALASAAGATVIPTRSQLIPAPGSGGQADQSPVPAAIAEYGVDAVRYALARAASPNAAAIESELRRPLDLANPFVAVSHACLDAAATRRRAADLGLARRMPDLAGPGAAGTTAPAELRLLDELAWLPERVAAAARRARPAELTAQLERIAAAWLDCRERCPALPFGGRCAPADPAGPLAAARLTLADATHVALLAGLRLLGVRPFGPRPPVP
jgi:arginyl-tRNA synthetase